MYQAHQLHIWEPHFLFKIPHHTPLPLSTRTVADTKQKIRHTSRAECYKSKSLGMFPSTGISAHADAATICSPQTVPIEVFGLRPDRTNYSALFTLEVTTYAAKEGKLHQRLREEGAPCEWMLNSLTSNKRCAWAQALFCKAQVNPWWVWGGFPLPCQRLSLTTGGVSCWLSDFLLPRQGLHSCLFQ